jgi:hypothetical protein
MPYSGKQIVSQIRTHVKKRGGTYTEWFVGVCKDVRKRLFNGHGVQKKGGHWIYLHAESSRSARHVRSYFIKKLGTTGDKSVGDTAGDFVYAYRKSEHTKP